jgi:hypothetical protein
MRKEHVSIGCLLLLTGRCRSPAMYLIFRLSPRHASASFLGIGAASARFSHLPTLSTVKPVQSDNKPGLFIAVWNQVSFDHE